MLIPNKTLVIRFSSIGDIILTSPLLRGLRKKFPSSRIDFITRKEYAELVCYNPHINFTFAFDAAKGFKELQEFREKIRREQYDLIIDVHNSWRSRYLRFIIGAKDIVTINKRIVARTMLVKFKKNIYREIVSIADRYIEPLREYGIENDSQGLELFIPDEILSKVSERMAPLKLNGYERIIGFCPSAKHATKRWPQERFIEVGVQLAKELNTKILLFGGKTDKSTCNSIMQSINASSDKKRTTDFSGQLSLLETAAAITWCDVVVTNDTGLMHIAAAVKKKVVALFGPTVREFGFFPVDTENVVLERNGLYCRPCSHIGKDTCPEGHFRCMNEITVTEVAESIKHFVNQFK